MNVKRVYHSGDTSIVAGDRWAVVRERPIGDDVLSAFYVRERHWEILLRVEEGEGSIFAEPDELFELSITRNAMRVRDPSIRERLACVAEEVADALANAPADALIEAILWGDKIVYRMWWVVNGNVTTVLMLEEKRDDTATSADEHISIV